MWKYLLSGVGLLGLAGCYYIGSKNEQESSVKYERMILQKTLDLVSADGPLLSVDELDDYVKSNINKQLQSNESIAENEKLTLLGRYDSVTKKILYYPIAISHRLKEIAQSESLTKISVVSVNYLIDTVIAHERRHTHQPDELFDIHLVDYDKRIQKLDAEKHAWESVVPRI